MNVAEVQCQGKKLKAITTKQTFSLCKLSHHVTVDLNANESSKLTDSGRSIITRRSRKHN